MSAAHDTLECFGTPSRQPPPRRRCHGSATSPRDPSAKRWCDSLRTLPPRRWARHTAFRASAVPFGFDWPRFTSMGCFRRKPYRDAYARKTDPRGVGSVCWTRVVERAHEVADRPLGSTQGASWGGIGRNGGARAGLARAHGRCGVSQPGVVEPGLAARGSRSGGLLMYEGCPAEVGVAFRKWPGAWPGTFLSSFVSTVRGRGIRTPDPLLPIEAAVTSKDILCWPEYEPPGLRGQIPLTAICGAEKVRVRIRNVLGCPCPQRSYGALGGRTGKSAKRRLVGLVVVLSRSRLGSKGSRLAPRAPMLVRPPTRE